MSDLSIVICTLNRERLLEIALKSLAVQEYGHKMFDVIVVDNNPVSTASMVSLCDVFSVCLQLKRINEATVGLSAARNAGIKASKAKLIAYLDDDAMVHTGWVHSVIQCFAETEASICGGPIYPWYETTVPDWVPLHYGAWGLLGEARRSMKLNEFASGGNMAFRREVLEQLGGFDIKYGMAGDKLGLGEETIFQLKARKQLSNIKIMYEPKMAIDHLVPAAKMRLRYMIHRNWETGATMTRMNQEMGEKLFVGYIVKNLIIALLRIALAFARCIKWWIRHGVSGWRSPICKYLLPAVQGLSHFGSMFHIWLSRISNGARPATQ